MSRFFVIACFISILAQSQAAPPPASYGVNYGGRYRNTPVEVIGKLGPEGANQENWNNLKSGADVNSGGGSFTAEIKDQNGNNPITLSTACRSVGGNDGGGDSLTNFQRLYNSGLREASGNWTITTKEPPFPGTYDVYVYSPGGGIGYGVNSGAASSWTSKSGGASGTFDLDQNYHVFTGLSGPLHIECGSIVGFSIVDPNAASGPSVDSNIIEIPLKDIDGKDTSLKPFEGKAILVVNVASKSGFTFQYKGLEALYQKYKEQGFVVVGFPCNDFGGQEAGTNAEIKSFATGKFGVTFPLMEKIHIKGQEQHPIYTQLSGPKAMFPGDVKWNFGKFLIGRDGKVASRFAPATAPDGADLVKALEAELARKAPKIEAVKPAK